MSTIIRKLNIFNQIKLIFTQQYKLLITLLVVALLLFGLFQIYIIYKNNQILKSSIDFYKVVESQGSLEFEEIMIKLSSENNFYGILSSLEIINLDLINNDIESSYSNYLDLLENRKLNNILITTIAIHGSYNLLDKINSNNELNIIDKVNIFLSFIDSSLKAFEGFKYEIKFLISVINDDSSNIDFLSDESLNIYKKIVGNEKILSSIKERVKKIHDFQKYK